MEGTVRTKPTIQGNVRTAPQTKKEPVLSNPTGSIAPGLLTPSVSSLMSRPQGVSAMDVVKGLPGAAKQVAGSITSFVAPALTGFTKKAGGVLGEGLAYATNKNVREQYEAGNTEILPNVNDTSVKEMAVSTFAAGLEAAIFKSFPQMTQMSLAKVGGAGALQGIGFAISSGLAEEKTPEEIVRSLPSYGIGGGVMAIIAPYLIPVLKSELGNVPTATRTTIRNLLDDIRTPTTAKPFQPRAVAEELAAQEPAGQVRTEPPTTQQLQQAVQEKVQPKPGPQVVQVPAENLPVGSGEKAVSRLEARMAGKAKDIPVEEAEKLGLTTYQKADHESQLIAAARFIEQKGDDVAFDVAMGRKAAPEGLLQNAVFVALQERAAQRADWALARKLASAQATRFGQELSILARVAPDDPVVAMREITLARMERARRGKGVIGFKKNVEQEMNTARKEVQKEIRVSRIKIQEAESMLNAILC